MIQRSKNNQTASKLYSTRLQSINMNEHFKYLIFIPQTSYITELTLKRA